MVNTDKILPLRRKIQFFLREVLHNKISAQNHYFAKKRKEVSFLCRTGHDPDAFLVYFFLIFSRAH